MALAPATLSATGLYTDIAAGTLSPCAKEYHPRFERWDDGVESRQFYALPAGEQIDTSDMDHWSMPVGAAFWEQFEIGGNPVETRVIWRVGAGANQFRFATYQWNSGLTDASSVTAGVTDANGTTHDIPSLLDCEECHDQVRERVLGFSALQLSHGPPGETIAALSAAGTLTVPAPDGFAIPGNAVEAGALAYLHTNCSSCHNPDSFDAGLGLDFRLSVTDATVNATATWTTTVGVANTLTHSTAVRVDPASPNTSGVYVRMSGVGTGSGMPRIGVTVLDTAGHATIGAWISGLP